MLNDDVISRPSTWTEHALFAMTKIPNATWSDHSIPFTPITQPDELGYTNDDYAALAQTEAHLSVFLDWFQDNLKEITTPPVAHTLGAASREEFDGFAQKIAATAHPDANTLIVSPKALTALYMTPLFTQNASRGLGGCCSHGVLNVGGRSFDVVCNQYADATDPDVVSLFVPRDPNYRKVAIHHHGVGKTEMGTVTGHDDVTTWRTINLP